MNIYHFTVRFSGIDARGKTITDTKPIDLVIQANTKQEAEKKLRASYFESVKIEIVVVTEKPHK